MKNAKRVIKNNGGRTPKARTLARAKALRARELRDAARD